MVKILIAGLAKTGTTGLLFLVANSFSTKPRLVFEPKRCPDDLHSESGIVVAKILIGSSLDAASFCHFDKKITLVRDPRDRIISSLLYSQYHGSYLIHDDSVSVVRRCLERKESDPANVSIREILEVTGRLAGRPDAVARYRQRAEASLRWFEKYVATIPDGLLYKYEDFVLGEYALLERHLGMSLSGAAKVPANLHRVERTKGHGDWRNWFTPEDVRDYQPLFSSWLEKYGYDPEDWTLNEKPSIAPEHCSGYFMRLVEEHRQRVAAKNPPAGAGGRLTGLIIRAEPRLVAGWAVGADPGQPIRVALLINGNEVARTMADKPRPELKRRGIHPTGDCGFIFRFEPGGPLRVGDQVMVHPVDVDFALNNSPSVVSAAAVSGE